jgi:hypothetical protein
VLKEGIVKLFSGWTSSVKEYLVHFRRNCQGSIRRSKFSVENLRSPKSRQILQRRKKGYGECFF